MRKMVPIVTAAALLLGSGWAVAQSPHHDAGSGEGAAAAVGPQMGSSMHSDRMPMMPGMMGMGHGSATMAERGDIHELLSNHDRITRSVTNLSNGIRTVTEADDPEVAAVIRKHVAEMLARVKQGRDPGLPIESATLRSLFPVGDKIRTTYQATAKGSVVLQTSNDPTVVKALQDHAVEVTDLARRGMVAAHEAMMKNGGGMMRFGMAAGADEPHREQ